ncbi:MAG TPA: type II secretion system protein [Vicinamibacterales bacterium]|jgi:prepilin-type N-terminal cleavage/methylation domain-containing protein|nr:type II secretion system protein [Vicinamibacterales bacterium]
MASSSTPASRRRLRTARGYTLIEIMIVVGLIGVVSAIAAPMMANALGYLRLSGDARNTSNAIALTKMRAASVFGRVRLYVDLSGKSFHVETFDHTTAICCWNVDVSGGTTYLSQNVTFGYGVVGTPPPNTQAAIGQPAVCKSNTNTDVGNTACVIFNSRGVPVDATGSPGVVTALYVTDGTAVYGLAVSATGMVRTWKTLPLATPSWSLQ